MRMRIFMCALVIIWGGFSLSHAALPANTFGTQETTEKISNTAAQVKDNLDKTVYDKFGRRITDYYGKVLRDPIPPDEPRPEPGKNFKKENDEFAKKMGYNPDWFNPDRLASWIYEDNKKYMQELGADKWPHPWQVANMNPYISYRNDVDIPKLVTGLQACEKGVYIGCNVEGTFLSYLTTGVMPTDYNFVTDNSYSPPEIWGLQRTGMYQNAYGTQYAGKDGGMDFSYSSTVTKEGAGGHVDFTFAGIMYGGGVSGGGGPTSRPVQLCSLEPGENYCVEVLTNATPYFTAQQAAEHFGGTLGFSSMERDPRYAYHGLTGQEVNSDKMTNPIGAYWDQINYWLAQYENWQVGNGQWDKNYKVSYMTRANNPSGTYTIPSPVKPKINDD